MTRLVFWIVAIVAVVWLLRRAIAGPRRADEAPPFAPQGDLVSCAHCGVNLPQAEAYDARGVRHDARAVLPAAAGSFYCSEEHWRLGPRGG
jgi:uncharacterized protein